MDEPEQGKRLGKGMIIGAWVLLLALLTQLFNGLLEQRANPNGMAEGVIAEGGVAQVSLRRNAQGHYVSRGLINGHPVTFLVDTGATQVAISERLAKRLGLPKQGGAFSHTANGVVAVWQTTLDRVRLGTIELRNVRATILPDLEPVDQVLLGMSFLKHLEMIQKDGMLTLRQHP